MHQVTVTITSQHNLKKCRAYWPKYLPMNRISINIEYAAHAQAFGTSVCARERGLVAHLSTFVLLYVNRIISISFVRICLIQERLIDPLFAPSIWILWSQLLL